jgi:hypothetical protein
VALKAAPAPASALAPKTAAAAAPPPPNKCGNGSTGGRSSVAHAGATAPGLIRCTNPHTVTAIAQSPHSNLGYRGGVSGSTSFWPAPGVF